MRSKILAAEYCCSANSKFITHNWKNWTKSPKTVIYSNKNCYIFLSKLCHLILQFLCSGLILSCSLTSCTSWYPDVILQFHDCWSKLTQKFLCARTYRMIQISCLITCQYTVYKFSLYTDYCRLLYSRPLSCYSTSFHWLVHGHKTSNNETVSCQMPWAGNIAKAMTSNGKQFTVDRCCTWWLESQCGFQILLLFCFAI